MSDLLHLLEKSVQYEAQLKELRQENEILKAQLRLIDARLAKERQRGTDYQVQQ